ncbi:hypothetical protein [Flectobacillus major]|uniref:hypothetical protein n=1 Tax=Flectobacillus major TaxID=103 RepID=UPI000401A1FE|nr:hypothetical protein [Flectobacillus major]
MKKALLISILIGGSLPVIHAQTGNDKPLTITPHISVENFNWIEKSTVGKAGVNFELKPSAKLNINLDLGAYKSLGSTYGAQENGASFSVNFSDFKTTPPYTSSVNPNDSRPKAILQGGFVNLDVGIPFKLSDSTDVSVEPFIGLEGKMWNRSLVFGQEGSSTTFDEKYKFLSPALGAKLNYNTKSKIKLTLRVGVSYPAISKLKTDEKNLSAPNTELNLSKHLSPSIEAGAKIKKMTIKIRYERLNIGSADSLRGISQPSTKANITGISIGYDF